MVSKSTLNCLIAISVLIFSSLFFQSCQRELDFEPGISPVNNVRNNVTVEGIITDERGQPLANVQVNAGNLLVMTDVNGSFRAANANFTTSELFVKASKPGYFTGSRTFIPRQGSNNFLRIQLLPKTEAGTINGNTGGTVQVGTASVNFSAGSFASANGTAYTGTVSVKAAYIDPTDPDMNQRMPGDLRGRRTNGDLRGLRSFGMIAVELETNTGQPLQLKTGSQASLKMTIPSTMLSTAPATIPLWWFDETTGLWKEEGSAAKVGNQYTGTVSHFTFWNVDDPFEYVQISMKVLSSSQQPLQGVEVKLTSLTDSSSSYDYTDNNGYVDGYVPKNTLLKREILDECNNVINSGMIGPFSSNTNTGDVIVSFSPAMQTITGSVTNCNNLPVTNGHVIINMQGHTAYATIVNGNFTSTFTRCNGVSSAIVIAVDDSTQQQSNPVTVTFSSQSANAGVIQACGTTIQTFLTFTVDGISRTWNSAPYELIAVEDTVQNSGFYDLAIIAWDSINGQGPIIDLLRPAGSFNAPDTVNMMSISIWDPLASANMLGDYFMYSAIQSPVLTSYGPVGSYVAGSFSGIFIRTDATVTDTVNVSCSF